MPPVTGTVDIARRPGDVSRYVADPSRMPEWQESVERAELLPPGTGVGARERETRRVGRSSRTFGWEVTDHVPGQRWGARGVDGPVRFRVLMTLTPVGGGTATRVGYRIDFAGRGVGRVLAPLARRTARREVPVNLDRLRTRLEQPSSTDAPRSPARPDALEAK